MLNGRGEGIDRGDAEKRCSRISGRKTGYFFFLFPFFPYGLFFSFGFSMEEMSSMYFASFPMPTTISLHSESFFKLSL
jgi:hypothetical protein